jgi:ATP-dependent Clp protease ATP-binding subunit ClpA
MSEREVDLNLNVVVTRFSQPARIVLFHARREVSVSRGAVIEPEHVVLGVLRADKSLIAARLKADWTLERVRSELKGQLTSAGQALPVHVEVPVAPAVRALIFRAAEIADRLGHRDIEPDHLLAALLQDETSSAGRVLRDSGISLDAILEGLTRQERP